MTLKFAPYILGAALASAIFTLPWAPVRAAGLVWASAAGLWLYLIILAQAWTGWWLAVPGIIGWLSLLNLAKGTLQREEWAGFWSIFFFAMIGVASAMAMLLASKAWLPRLIEKRENEQISDEHGASTGPANS